MWHIITISSFPQLPEFPSKKMFGSLSPALIKERQAALEKYMKAIALDETVRVKSKRS
jgi:hypothetical protein